jgi:hypothetical protein
MATEARFLQNAPTQNRLPDFTLPQCESHNSIVCICCYNSGYRQDLISVIPYCKNGPLFQTSLTDIGYYIRTRWINQMGRKTEFSELKFDIDMNVSGCFIFYYRQFYEL